MGLHFSSLLEKLLEHATGLAAEDGDHLLSDVQAWLLDNHLLTRMLTTAPCELAVCQCRGQLDADTALSLHPVICYRQLAVGKRSPDAPNRLHGRIKFYNERKEFGFVIPDGGGKDIFLHRHALGNIPPSELTDGCPVTFTVEDCSHGRRVTTILLEQP